MLNRIIDKLWRVLASLKTGIFLMTMIALTNLGGSFIVQRDQAPDGQIEKVYSPETIKVLESLGLFDLYHSWWFILLLTITGISLIIASIDIWPRYWAWVVEPLTRLKEQQYDFFDKSVRLKSSVKVDKQQIESLVEKNFAKLESEEADGKWHFWAQKGRWCNLSVFVIHTGLLFVLIGGFIGARYGFEGQVRLSEGQASNLFLTERGRGAAQPLGFTIKLNDVRMETYPDGSPKAYYSDLEILEQGHVMKQETIKVNHPMEYKGIYFYQAQYGTQPTNERFTATVTATQRKTGVGKDLNLEQGKVSELSFKDGASIPVRLLKYVPQFQLPMGGETRNIGEAIQLAVGEGDKAETFWVFKTLPSFDQKMRKGRYSFVFQSGRQAFDVGEFSGLAVGYNPGISTVWFGSTILLTGLMWNILGSHRKLWGCWDGTTLRLAGKTRRGSDRFDKNFQQLIERLQQELQSEEGIEGLVGTQAMET